MKVAIMQPYFFPYIGYFSLIQYTNKFVIFDKVQFIRHGWIERNRILKPNNGWQYIKVPLFKHHRDILIKDIEIKNSEPWKEKIKAQLIHYKKRSPFYNECMDVVSTSLSIQTNSIVELNKNILNIVCNYLNIPLNLDIFSKMDIQIEDVKEADEWALKITKSMGFIEYVNPIGGIEFFNKEKYIQNNIKLTFLKNNLNDYKQNREFFEPGLSIIDVMMFNDKESIHKMLNNFELI